MHERCLAERGGLKVVIEQGTDIVMAGDDDAQIVAPLQRSGKVVDKGVEIKHDNTRHTKGFIYPHPRIVYSPI